MPNKPILIFPRAVDADYTRRERSIPPGPNVTPEEQAIKLNSRWQQVMDEWDAMTLSSSMQGSISERVLVLEVKGTIDEFYAAVKQTEELQFLGEEFDFSPDNAIIGVEDESDPYYSTETRIFLTLQNEASLNRIIQLWQRYTQRQEFDRGLGRYAQLFQLLNDVRFYSVQDRLRDTGFERYVTDMLAEEREMIRIEVELLFRTRKDIPPPRLNSKTGRTVQPIGREETDYERNQAVFDEFRQVVQEAGGRVVEGSRVIIPEINYHALVIEAPIDLFEELGNNTDVALLKANQVLYFRPMGQTSWIGRSSDDQALSVPAEPIPDAALPQGEPIAALFDGLPLQNHQVLADRLDVDADGVDEALYPPAGRFHGTAMATLITRGDLSDTSAQPLQNKLYVRPVMIARPWGADFIEEFPQDRLPVDVIHQAVRRLFEPTGDLPPVAPGVRIINLSIGDVYRPFHHTISSWARLLDWLACRYNVLFIVSAGNIAHDIDLDIPVVSFDGLSQEELQQRVLDYIVSDNLNRKILTPSESINAVTVGAAQSDAGPNSWHATRLPLVYDPNLSSPISRIGFGYRGAIKPDILMPGGRKTYRKRPIQSNPQATTSLAIEQFAYSTSPPGIKVAIPLPVGSLNSTAYLWGTSNAAALTTRLACQLHEMLVALNREALPQAIIPEKYFVVIIKALLVHGASWGPSHESLVDIVKNKLGVPDNYTKKHITPYLGYGVVNSQRVLYCTDNRVTLLGWGELKKEKAHEFTFPLPTAIESLAIEKRLTITLAWLSPVNWKTRKYRQARLYFDNVSGGHVPGSEVLNLERDGVDYHTSRRGTIQHDILTGDSAEAYVNGGNLIIKVNCRQDAPTLSSNDRIPYGLAVTFEVNESAHVAIYEEIKQRLEVQNRIRP